MPGGKGGSPVPKEAKELLKWFTTQVQGYEPTVGAEQAFVGEMMPLYTQLAKSGLAAQPVGFDYSAYQRAVDMARQQSKRSTLDTIGQMRRLGLGTSGEAVGISQAANEALGNQAATLANIYASQVPERALARAELAGSLATPRLLQILSGVAGTGGQLGLGIGQINQQRQQAFWDALARLGAGAGFNIR